MSKLKNYRLISKEKAETLSFHNLKRLMNKVRGHISFWENTDIRGYHVQYPDTVATWNVYVDQELYRHKTFFNMLREISKKFSHKNTPKLKVRRI